MMSCGIASEIAAFVARVADQAERQDGDRRLGRHRRPVVVRRLRHGRGRKRVGEDAHVGDAPVPPAAQRLDDALLGPIVAHAPAGPP